MTALTLPQPDRVATAAWLRHGAALGVLLLFTLAAFRSSVSAAVQVWQVSPTYSHCFLIVPIIVWLIWEKRDALAMLAPGMAPRALFFIPLFTLGWWLGELAAINEVQQYAVVGIMQALIVALLGVNVVRLIWFPVLYLLFLVPTGEYLIVPMQNFATHFVDVSLNILGIIHYTEGTTFELTNGRFEIAEACAGLRFLIATVTLGVLFSYLMFRKIYKTVLFLVACVAVPLIGNGLRCVGIIVLAHLTNNQYGAGADHIVYGWGFNVAILLILGVIGSRFRDDAGEKIQVRTNPAIPPARLAGVTALAAILLSTGPALAWWHDNYFVKPDLAAITQPFHPAGWHEGPASPSWQPDFFGLDASTSASFAPTTGDAAIPVDFYLGYYARPRPGHSMTAHANRLWNNENWNLSDVNQVSSVFAGKRIQFEESIITSFAKKRLIWSSYWVDGHFTTSLFKVKLLQAGAALQGHEGQAVIALSTELDGTVEEARGRLSRSLPAVDALPARLDQANHRMPVQDPLTVGGRP
jgi:exosortase A